MTKEVDVEQQIDLQIDPKQLKRNHRNQIAALTKKSAIYQWRQYKTNACQIFFPLLLIVLLRLLQILVSSFVRDLDGSKVDRVVTYPAIPYYMVETDIDFSNDCPRSPLVGFNPIRDVLYLDESGEGDLLINNFTNSYLKTIKGQIFPDRGNTQQFCKKAFFYSNVTWTKEPNKSALDKTLYDSYSKKDYLGGYYFRSFGLDKIDLSVVYNRTLTRAVDVPFWIDQITQVMLRSLNVDVVTQLEGKKDYPTKATVKDFDLISLIGPFLYIFIFQLTFPVILGSIVYEKEQKLKEIMKMMGLEMKVYWLVTYVWSYILYFLTFAVIWIAAAALGFRYYTVNDAGPIFILFFLWGHLLVAFALFFSVILNKSRTATVVGYIWVFATGVLAGQVISSYFENEETPRGVVFVLTCIPQFALYRGLLILSRGVIFDGTGLSMDQVDRKDMDVVYGFMVVEWVIFMLLAIYLELVLKTGYGVKKHPLFFLQKSFWTGEKVIVKSELQQSLPGEPEDVAQLRKELLQPDNGYFLQVEDLVKKFPGSNGLPDKIAVNNLALGVKQGECFGFLGPNGAGKTTTISILCGLYRPTSGTANVMGLDIRNDIDKVHMIMGVCPQDNVLWDDLTGPEHLEFYGRIKNLTGKELKNAIHEALKAVNLHEETRKKSSQYSGGMKRRLSVACSLMGNPKLVLLDEPSTGLDPASRRQLWEVINTQKKKCAMLLTTHAMEEADALCDRLGIFVKGNLKCVGTSSELKKRYGKGYKLTVTTLPTNIEKVDGFIRSLAKDASLLNTLSGTSNYEVPKSSVHLSKFFSALKDNAEEYQISDWGLSNTTLEEVFLKITDQEKEVKEVEVVAKKNEDFEMQSFN